MFGIGKFFNFQLVEKGRKKLNKLEEKKNVFAKWWCVANEIVFIGWNDDRIAQYLR